jgi:hypothetical protein
MNYLKIGLIALAVLFVIALFGKTYQAGRERERSIMQVKVAKLEAESRAKEQADRDKLQAASIRYEILRDSVINDDRPVPIVSVPKCPRRSSVPSSATLASEPSETAADGLDRENGQARAAIQFSNGLREYAKDAKTYAAQLMAIIQEWPSESKGQP